MADISKIPEIIELIAKIIRLIWDLLSLLRASVPSVTVCPARAQSRTATCLLIDDRNLITVGSDVMSLCIEFAVR